MNVLCRGLQGKISLLNGDCRRMYTCIDGPVVRGEGGMREKGISKDEGGFDGEGD